MVLRHGFWSEDWAHLLQNGERTLAGRMLRVRKHDLVLCGSLQREAARVIAGVITVVRRPIQVRFVEQRALPLVVVIANLVERSVLSSRGREEPQFVAFDRTAQPSPDVVVPSD